MQRAGTISDVAYFPVDYLDSRRRFRERAETVSPPSDSARWKIPSQIDEDLTIDHLWMPPTERPEKLFVVLSGIHGSEGYAGAAVQFMLMDEILPRVDRGRAGFLLVHAMNPFGFKYHRRETENHVNLNRNFSVSGELYRDRHEDSLRMNERFLLRAPVASLRSPLLERLKMRGGKAHFDEVSLDAFVKAIGPGQFERPEHLEFGGRGPEPQTGHLIQLLRDLIPDFPDTVLFDIHTGLGERNRLHLLVDKPLSQLNPEFFRELFDPSEDAEFYEFTPPDAEGFYEVKGATNAVVEELAQDGQRAIGVTMEYGTLGHSLEAQLEALNSWIVCHQGQHYGYANAELEARARQANFARSYPDDDEWRSAVIAAARGMFSRVLKRSHLLT